MGHQLADHEDRCARFSTLDLSRAPGQIRAIARLTVSNMLIWHVCVILGVKLLSSGRAAILGYTMPVWAALCGLLFFGERVSRIAWLGVGFALAGALLLLSSEFATISGQPLGSVLVLIGAAGWGYGSACFPVPGCWVKPRIGRTMRRCC
jgi:drug/metabolite transporter (DMT)-like permease